MEFFNRADWLVIILYLLGMVLLGVWFGKDQKSTRDYFLGSKTIPWWGVGFSIVATETSALTIISVPAMAYGGNISFIQIIIGYVIARVVTPFAFRSVRMSICAPSGIAPYLSRITVGPPGAAAAGRGASLGGG